MKEKQRIDKIIESVLERIQSEVGDLIGVTLSLTAKPNTIISKADFFDQPLGKQVLAKMDVTGELEGLGCLLVSVKDAIRLGGTLIMLPENELKDVVSAEDYSEETEDSYGEIANIIAGSYTKTFEEMHNKKFRFVRKTQEVIIPAKIDIESDEPIADQNYYQVTATMAINDTTMGDMIMLMPAATFGLEEESAKEDSEEETSSSITGKKAAEEEASASQGNASDVAGTPSQPDFDIEKHRKKVDGLLELVRQQMASEVGAMLGVEAELNDFSCRMICKEDFFMEEVTGKQVLAHMDLVGEVEDKAFLFVSLKDAIYIGGTLIMLPPPELDSAIGEENFGEDTEDAYGEIANIISGSFSGVFEEQYTRKFRFIKTELEQVMPMKVDIESEDPMPDRPYYMSSATLKMADKELGGIQMLIPAEALQLENLGRTQEANVVQSSDGKSGISEKSSSAQDSDVNQTALKVGGGEGSVDILLVSDDEAEAEKINTALQDTGLTCQVLSFKESVNNYLPGNVKAVFLVMREVNEQSFGVAIKISTASSVPLVAAGPAWTRSKVIKAVKYGVDEILVTPCEAADIEAKVQSLSIPLAA